MLTERQTLLASILAVLPTMDVPIQRMRMSPTNVRWLLRNLRSRNNDHPDINLVIGDLKKLARLDIHLTT